MVKKKLERLKKNNFICGFEKYIINSSITRSFKMCNVSWGKTPKDFW
jgi:hypothetical protein